MTDDNPDNPPEKVFIVPYRDREPHKLVFTRVMPYILGDSNYRILFLHQQDRRPFNRGGIKNIGFHYVKKKWPEHWIWHIRLINLVLIQNMVK